MSIQNGIVLGRKKNETLPFTKTRMDLEVLMLREISQADEDKCSRFHLYVECRKQSTRTNKTEKTDGSRERTDGCQGGGARGLGAKAEGSEKHTLAVTKGSEMQSRAQGVQSTVLW